MLPRSISRTYATSQKPPSPPTAPPKPRQYVAPEERISRHRKFPDPPPEPVKKTLFSRLWPFKSRPQETIDFGPKDPARGAEASRRFVTQGIIDPRYKPAARKVTLIIVCTPVALYLSYELFLRRFMGKQQKQIPVAGVRSGEQQDGVTG